MTDSINTITLSRDSIRTNIISNMKSYLELEGVDLTKSSFLSFIIDTMSTLTSNLLFYEVSVFREFFMTTAKTPEAIYNLSAFLGYGIQDASYASCDVLITIPLEFDSSEVTFNIPENFRFYAGDIQFQTYYTTSITIINNEICNIVITKDNAQYNIPSYIDTTSSETSTVSIILPTRQYKTLSEEFQVDDNIQNDMEAFKFLEKEIVFEGNDITTQQVSDMTVMVTEPGSEAVEYNPPQIDGNDVHSLYLLEYDEEGYIARKTDNGLKIYFGNGLIGKRPASFSTINVDIQITEGYSGNVISGAIKSGDKLYFVDDNDGLTKSISYTVINTNSATGGKDGESLEEIRKNSIFNITALNRLVSENDYNNIATLASDLPIVQQTGSSHIIPILKRADVQVNEIQLFTPLIFNDEIVPTRNVKYSPSLEEISDGIPAKTEISHGALDFYTLFNIDNIDTNNKSAGYTYVINEISQSPSLVSHYETVDNVSYDIIATEINTQKITNDGTAYIDFELNYISSETDTTACSCIMYSTDENDYIEMEHSPNIEEGTGSFTARIKQSLIDTGEITYYFIISHLTLNEIVKYSNALIIKEDLDDFMKSNLIVDSTSGEVTIYDIPVIEKQYYEALETPPTATSPTLAEFELNAIQKLISGMDLNDKRMLNDFVNLKLTNTIGNITNMSLNLRTELPVLSKSNTSVPSEINHARYIINGTEGTWEDYNDVQGKPNQIAEYIIGIGWVFTSPKMNDTVVIEDEIDESTNKQKKYIFSVYGWIYPEYEMPFKIEAEVVKSETYTGTSEGLRNSISNALIEDLAEYFGNDITLYRSKITDIIHSVDGVSHCRVIKPESNIFFNYELKNLTYSELLEYGPEYIFTTLDDITIIIL